MLAPVALVVAASGGTDPHNGCVAFGLRFVGLNSLGSVGTLGLIYRRDDGILMPDLGNDAADDRNRAMLLGKVAIREALGPIAVTVSGSRSSKRQR